jgi:hypothetical protein
MTIAGRRGQFVACSFWLVSALGRNGRVEEPRGGCRRLRLVVVRSVRQRAKQLVRHQLAARNARPGPTSSRAAVGRGAGVDFGGEGAQHPHEPSGRMVGLERRDLRGEQQGIAAEGDGPVGEADWPHERESRRGTRFAPVPVERSPPRGSRPRRAAQRSGSSRACDAVRLGHSPTHTDFARDVARATSSAKRISRRS